MESFIKYHPRKCASIIRAISIFFMIITLVLGVIMFFHQGMIQSGILNKYHLTLSRDQTTIVREYAKKVPKDSTKYKKVQSSQAKKYIQHQKYQKCIGCLTILVMYFWWASASLIINDFFRPLIPLGLYWRHIKHKLNPKDDSDIYED